MPIHNMAGRLMNLRSWLEQVHSKSLPVETLLIHDGGDSATKRELIALSQNFSAIYDSVNVKSPGLARNRGIELSSAPWVAFWDSDDLGFPEAAVKCIEESTHQTQAIIGQFEVLDLKTNGIRREKKKPATLNEWALNPGIWRILFRREFIGERRFCSSRMGEDQLFLSELGILESEIKFVDDIIYRYSVGHENQLTYIPEAKAEISLTLNMLKKFIIDNNREADYIFVFFARLTITELWRVKNGFESIARMIVLFARIDIRKKANMIRGFIYVAASLLKNRKLL